MADALPNSIAIRLGEAGGEELEELLETWGDRLSAADVLRLLRNPFCSEQMIRQLMGRRPLLAAYEVRRELALNPRTPQVPALGVISGLYWRDLVSVGLDMRLRPQIRRAADQRLLERLPGLAVGEKVAIARRASQRVLSALRHDQNRRVIEALLENPRLTEGMLMPLLASETTSPEALRAVADNRRWGVRYLVRLALCKNPRAPTSTTLPLLPMLKKKDLRALARDQRLADPVRRRAALLCGAARS